MVSQNGVSCISSFWKEYSETKNLSIRNSLVEIYLGTVVCIAKRIKAKLPEFIELGDLISAGAFGLMGAIETFDLSHGVKFETYCAPRIRGAILDEMRSMDWVPRLVRSNVKKYKLALEALDNCSGNIPTLQEIADHLEISVEEAERVQTDGSTPIVHFYDIVNTSKGEWKTSENQMSYDIPDKKTIRPDQELSKNDGFAELILCLNDVERIVVTLYHRDDYEMWKIGKILGLSESRVSQMHSDALQKIKDSLSL